MKNEHVALEKLRLELCLGEICVDRNFYTAEFIDFPSIRF